MHAAYATPDELLAPAVAAVRAGSDALRAALEPLSAPAYATDRDGRLIFANEACQSFAGRTPKPGEDRWCVSWKLFSASGESLPHEDCPMAVAIREKRPVRGAEAVAERPDGSRVRFVPYPTPAFDERGELLGAVNMLVEAGSRKEAAALAAQASKCRRLARSITDQRTAQTLILMAGEYEEKARSLNF